MNPARQSPRRLHITATNGIAQMLAQKIAGFPMARTCAMSRAEVARVEVDRSQHEQPRPRARVVRVRRRVRVGRDVERRRLAGSGGTRAWPSGSPTRPSGSIRSGGTTAGTRSCRRRSGDQQERDDEAEALLADRPRERASERGVAPMAPRSSPTTHGQDQRAATMRHASRPLHGERGAERDAGGEAPRSPEREGDRRARADDHHQLQLRGVARRAERRIGLRLGFRRRAPVDPSPVQQEEQEPSDHPELQVDVEQRRSRQHDVEVLDRRAAAPPRTSRARCRTTAAR